MITQGSSSGLGSGLGSGSGVEPIYERLHDLIAAEVTRVILDATPVIFVTIKEDIMEIMEERLRCFQAEIAIGQIGDRAPSFWEFNVCGVPGFFGFKDPITCQ